MIIEDTANALYTTLTGGTALTSLLYGTVSVYHITAPDDAGFPHVVYNLQAGGPNYINPSNMESNEWYVRAYSTTSAKNAIQIFKQIDLLLHKKNISIGSTKTMECVRMANFALNEKAPNGLLYYSCGGIYNIRTTNT